MIELQHNLDLAIEDDDPTPPPKGVAVDRAEVSLWSEVIRLALRDALDGDIRARFWFFDTKSSFSLACHVAGLCASRVRSRLAHMPHLWANQQVEELHDGH